MENARIASDITFNIRLDDMTASCPGLRGAEDKAGELAEYICPILYRAHFTAEACDDGRVVLGDGLWTIRSFYAARGISGCKRATLIAATIGDALPKHSEMCFREGRLWEGAVADLLGSYAVEAVVEEFFRSLSLENRRNGLFPSVRFSPGYGDWLLEDQSMIISLLAAGDNITVGSNHMLEPVKSVTALVGWSGEQRPGTYPAGDRGRGLCQGNGSCSNCRTWACLKKETGRGNSV